MKRTVKIAALAFAVMALTVACKSKTEQVEDTTPIEETECIETVVDSIVDTTVAEVVEEVTGTVKKPTTKKVQENKSDVKAVDANSTVNAKSEAQNASGRLSRTQAQNSDVTTASDQQLTSKKSAEQNAVGRLGNRK